MASTAVVPKMRGRRVTYMVILGEETVQVVATDVPPRGLSRGEVIRRAEAKMAKARPVPARRRRP